MGGHPGQVQSGSQVRGHWENMQTPLVLQGYNICSRKTFPQMSTSRKSLWMNEVIRIYYLHRVPQQFHPLNVKV